MGLLGPSHQTIKAIPCDGIIFASPWVHHIHSQGPSGSSHGFKFVSGRGLSYRSIGFNLGDNEAHLMGLSGQSMGRSGQYVGLSGQYMGLSGQYMGLSGSSHGAIVSIHGTISLIPGNATSPSHRTIYIGSIYHGHRTAEFRCHRFVGFIPWITGSIP